MMKKIILSFFLFFFVKNSFCVIENENYRNLINKLEKVEELVIGGYNIFKKKKPENGNPSKNTINTFIKKVQELKIPRFEGLINHISSVIEKTDGLTYLIERYEEFDELMNMLYFYYDILRAKLHDMCMHDTCEIPFYLKIEKSELNSLREVVLGKRNPLLNIKSNLKKLEDLIKVHKETVKTLTKEIQKENETINSKKSAIEGADTDKVNNRKQTYRSEYNIYFYNKQLEETQKIIEILSQHVKKLKANEEIKKLLTEIKEKSTPPNQEQNKETIAGLEAKVQNIAKTIEFNADGLYTDPLELEYYLREKKKSTKKAITNNADNQDDIMISDKSNETYPNGIEYPLTETDIKKVLYKEDEMEPFGKLYDPNYGDIIDANTIFKNKEELKSFIDKTKNSISQTKLLLTHLKPNYDRLRAEYDKEATAYKPLIEEFYNLKHYNGYTEEKFKNLYSKRNLFLLNKHKLKTTADIYETSQNFINKLETQSKYLEDYLLRNNFAKKEVQFFEQLKEKLENEISGLTEEIVEFEGEVSKDSINMRNIDSIDEEIKVNKIIIGEKIQELKKIEELLNNAKLKEKLHVPQVYKTSKKEPYYLVAIKHEVDKMKTLIPKIKELLETEKTKLEELTKPTTETTTNTQVQPTVVAAQEEAVDVQQGTQPADAPAQPTQVPSAVAPVTSPEPSSDTQENAVETSRKKIEFFEKLYKFLSTSYICHKYILLSNSTMSKTALERYNFTDEEKEKLSLCESSDLLFNLQNRAQVMYSMYDSVNSDLQELNNKIFEKELVYNLYQLRDNQKIKELLTVSEAPTDEASPEQSQGENLRRASEESSLSSSELNQVTQANEEQQVQNTTEENSVQTHTFTSRNQDNLSELFSITEEQELDTNFFKSFLLQNETYENEDFKNFVVSKAGIIKEMNAEKEKELLKEINELKEKLNKLFSMLNKYKLKLDRLIYKKGETSRYRSIIKKINILKEQLQKKLSILDKPKETLKNFSVFFEKKKENEKEKIKNLLQNNEALLKHYKSMIKYYNGELSPVKSISNLSIQKENSYVSLETFKALSKAEGMKRKNINLEKNIVSFLSSGLHHLFSELEKLVENNNYTGKQDSENEAAVKEALDIYSEFFPKTQEGKKVTPPATEETHVDTSAEEASLSPATETENTQPGETESPPVANQTCHQGEGSSCTGSQDETHATDGNTHSSSSSSSHITQEASGNSNQVVSGTSQEEDPDANILSGIDSTNSNQYLRSIAETYKTLRKEIEKHIETLNNNVVDLLESSFKKRKHFLDVLDYDLAPFKHESSDDYIIEDPYKIIDPEKRNKLLNNYIFALTSINKDITFINDNMSYFTKISEKFGNQLEQIKGIIGKKSEPEKLLPFLTSVQNLYERLMESTKNYEAQLTSKLTTYTKEKTDMEHKIQKITEDKKIEEAIETLKKKKKEKEQTQIQQDPKAPKQITTKKYKELLDKFRRLRIISKRTMNSIFSNTQNINLEQVYSYIEKHVCVNTECPENAGCFRHLNGVEVCKCLLNFKKEGDVCVPNDNATCKVNNGGCDKNAMCMDSENEITCICKIDGSYPIHEGIFCSSSNFLSLSLLLIVMFILYNFF